jgi:hypothetical protein
VSSSPGQVFIEELEEEVFIGIQFAKEIVGHMTTSQEVTPHDVSVLAEELSHFKFLADVVENEAKTSLLILETMGEIDRFLCVMHWNHMAMENAKFTNHWKNIHEICDYVFTGDRFHHKDKKLYIDAENLAFKHLKAAFADKWDCTHYNFSEINQSAQNYLQPLRRKFLSL